MIRSLTSRLRDDASGVTVVEFALIAPVMIMTLMGMFDLGYNMYTATMLDGAIQQAARNSTIEGAAGKASALDDIVSSAVHGIAPDATITFKRSAYSSFADVGKAESYTDVNGDGTCDLGEPFEDVNGNGTWDADQAKTGQGGSRDAVLYQVTVNYQRPFPVTAFFGMSPDYTLTASTVLRNQPYDNTAKSPPAVAYCL